MKVVPGTPEKSLIISKMLHSENLIVTPDDSDERLSGDLDIFKIENGQKPDTFE